MSIYWAGGVPLSTHNVTSMGDGFYVSYNYADRSIYGDVTTALVWGQMQAFYILNGDHYDAYKALIPQGWDACYAYFLAHAEQANERSDHGDPQEVIRKFHELISKLPKGS